MIFRLCLLVSLTINADSTCSSTTGCAENTTEEGDDRQDSFAAIQMQLKVDNSTAEQYAKGTHLLKKHDMASKVSEQCSGESAWKWNEEAGSYGMQCPQGCYVAQGKGGFGNGWFWQCLWCVWADFG